MLYDSSQLEFLLKQWGCGGLDGIVDDGHAIAGLEGCVITYRGITPQRLAERFTIEDVSSALQQLEPHQAIALSLVYVHGWTTERLARVRGCGSVSHIMSYWIDCLDDFARTLIDGQA